MSLVVLRVVVAAQQAAIFQAQSPGKAPFHIAHANFDKWFLQHGISTVTVQADNRVVGRSEPITSGMTSGARGSLCAEAFRAIEADLEAFSPGRAAAHDGHGRFAEGERAFSTIMYILLMQRAGVKSGTGHLLRIGPRVTGVRYQRV